MVERREFPRRPLSEDVHCYIDGVRFDARTMDLSVGGTFVRTTRWRQVTAGALVGLVFPRNRLSPHTTFLFGRVARVQEGIVEGLALAWEKAVTVAPAEDLARFLKATFGIEDAEIHREAPGPRGESRNVFLFSTISRSRLRAPADDGEEGDPPADLAAAPAAAAAGKGVVAEAGERFDAAALGADTLQVRAEDLDGLDLEVIPLDRNGARLPEASREPAAAASNGDPPPLPYLGSPPPSNGAAARGRRGQISVMVAREARLAVALSGVLESRGDRLFLEVVRLGLDGAIARTAFAPMDGATDLVLHLEIPARRGPVALACRCASVVAVTGPAGESGLDLCFASVDEGTSPGVLERYLKYLQFQELARS